MATQHKTETKFVICLRNDDSEDLQLGKVYHVLTDDVAALDNYIRVVDESGEDYLYPASFFAPIDLPRVAERTLFPVAGD